MAEAVRDGPRRRVRNSSDALGPTIERLDVLGMVKASQAVSGEIVPEKLVEKLLAIVLDQAGAERAMLVLPLADAFTIEAEAKIHRGGVTMRLVQRPPTPKDLPESVLRHVAGTREPVIVDDAGASSPYATDDYVKSTRMRSILCLPLVKQNKLVGVLYLENGKMAGAFTRDRLALLGVLASQAAISLENARLYRDLVDERSRLQAVIQQVPAALLITEAPSGRIIIANDRVEPILHRKYQPVSSVGEYKEYVGFHPDGRRYAPHEWPLARSLLEGEVVDGEEIRVLWADGNTGWISVNSGPIRDREGKITASVAIFSDVTERKRKEEALRISEARFSVAFHDSPTPMAIVRLRDGWFVDANERCLQTFGYEQEEFIGHSVEELGIASLGELEKFRRLLEELGSFQEAEFVGVTKSGDPRTLLVSQEALELDGEMCALTTFVDVTERKQVEAQLRQSQKMEAIGSLAGGVAHDFNNLLTVINGSAELLMLQMEASHPNYALCESILETGERAAELTRQLLMFSRKEVSEPKDWNLNSIVVGMKGMLRRLIEEDVDLTTSLARDCGPIHADRIQVEQVILNLVVNARDAMPRGGRIVIETGNVVLEQSTPDTLLEVSPGPYVMLAVKDNGAGIDPELRAKVFEPFFTTKEVGRGSGLGLAVVYGIVKQSGGNVSITSQPGDGTTLRVYFPRAAEATEVARPAERPRPYRGTERVLLAEDELGLRRFMTQALEFQGYRVTPVRNGRKALALLKDAKQEFDLVVTDLVMPDMGGRELAKHMADEHISVPILFTSGYSEDLARWVKADQVEFLPKPFRASELARKIRSILDRTQTSSSPTS
jgi:two-component system, cell cycle sensor histidine kinase and response regulator CckA